MTDFDGLRCAVTAGDGVVARFPGVVCVAVAADQQASGLVRTLLEHCREAAGSAPGRVLARRLASWLGGLGDAADELHFGTVAATGDDGLAVFLLGGVRLLIPELDTEISGTDAASWTDRLLARPDAAVVLTPAGVAGPLDAVAGVHDLRAGIVPGSAVVLLHLDTMPGSDDAMLPPRLEDRPEPPSIPAPPRRAEPILGIPDDEPRRPPLSSGRRGEPSDGEAGSQGEPRARGHLCSRGHLNDPRSHFCVLCGIRMNERTGVLVIGARPPLGLLVFDNGTTYTVDGEYLIGRMPEVDERVRTGALRPIAVGDDAGSVSRVHAEVRLDGWDVMVVDSGSSNGTYLAPPGEDWAQLRPQESRRLAPGTRVRLGESVFVFESPSGVR